MARMRGTASEGQEGRSSRVWDDRCTGAIVVLVVIALALLLLCVEIAGGPPSGEVGRYWPLLP